MGDTKEKLIRIENFTKGVNQFYDSLKLPDDSFTILENYDIMSYNNYGSLVKRNGFQQYNTHQLSGYDNIQTLYEAVLSGGNILLANTNNGSHSVLNTITGDYTGLWGIPIDTGIQEANKLNFCVIKDKVYIANMNNSSNHIYHGTNFLEVGCPPLNVAGFSVIMGNAGGNMGQGIYKYIVTYLYDGYMESFSIGDMMHLGLRVVNITSDNNYSKLTLPIGNARVTARKIYRSNKNDNTNTYYYVDTVSDNTTTIYNDGKNDDALGDEIDLKVLYNFKKPFICSYQIIHKNRLIQANIKDNFYNPLNSSDITLQATNGGNLANGIYQYEFRKLYYEYPGSNNLIMSAPVIIPIKLNPGQNAVMITINSNITNNNWINAIAFRRTEVNGNNFYWEVIGLDLTSFPFTDINDDTTLINIDIQDKINYILNIPGNDINFPNYIAISDDNMPDLVDAGNVIKIGEDNSGINAILSEENRIIIFKQNSIHYINTQTQSTDFWSSNKLYDFYGCDPGLAIKFSDRYFFIQSSNDTNKTLLIYVWDGRSEPIEIGGVIIDYIQKFNSNSILDIKYNQRDKTIWILATTQEIHRSNETYILIYDTLGNNWTVYTNATNINFKSLEYSQKYGMLIGGGDSYIYKCEPKTWQDFISGNQTPFKTKLQTKNFQYEDFDVRPKRFRCDVISGTAAGTTETVTLFTGATNPNFTGEKYVNLTTNEQGAEMTGPGLYRLRTRNFDQNIVGTSCRYVYFRIEEQSNCSLLIQNIQILLGVDHESSGGI